MAVRQLRYLKEEFAQRGDEIYESQVRQQVEKDNFGFQRLGWAATKAVTSEPLGKRTRLNTHHKTTEPKTRML